MYHTPSLGYKNPPLEVQLENLFEDKKNGPNLSEQEFHHMYNQVSSSHHDLNKMSSSSSSG